MSIRELLSQQSVCIDDNSVSKTAILQHVSRIMANIDDCLKPTELFDAFWQREHLGSTAIGEGVAIPHIRSISIKTMHGCFIKLEHPVDFGAPDKKPVDLVFALMVPDSSANEHLLVLSELVALFHNQDFRNACRKSNQASELYKLFCTDDQLFEML